MKALAAIAMTALTVGLMTPAQAQPDTAIVAGPGASRARSFATPVMAVRPGDKTLLVNLDVIWHGIESEDMGPDDRPWCELVDPDLPEDPLSNPRRKPLGECPLFWADAAVVGGTSTVQGLEGVTSGRVYAFQCTTTSGMAGDLFVV